MSDENPTNPAPLEGDDLAAVERLKAAFNGLKGEMSKVIVGQHAVLEELLIAIFARFAEAGNYYIFTTFVLSYITTQLGISREVGLLASILGAAANVAMIPVYGRLSDAIGRSRTFLLGGACIIVTATPIFLLIQTGQTWAIIARCPRKVTKAPRLMAAAYRLYLDAVLARGWAKPRARVKPAKAALVAVALRHGIV